MSNKYLELAKKIYELSKNGIAGEKESAKKKLDEILKKYNISIDELEDEKDEVFFFKIKIDSFDYNAKLLSQICGLINVELKGEFPKSVIQKHGLRGNFAINCTNSKFVEIRAKYDFYLDKLKIKFDDMYYAFLMKNELLISSDKESEITERDINAYLLSQALKKDNYHLQLN
jgi:hypothetical protein